MIYDIINKSNYGIIVDILNKQMNMSLPAIGLKETIFIKNNAQLKSKIITIGTDNNTGHLIFTEDDELLLFSLSVFDNIDVNNLQKKLVSSFREITIDKIINYA